MRLGEFFRPGFWDILGAALGFVGLSVAGTFAIKVAPSGQVLVAILVANVLMVVGGYSLKSYLFSKDFPFRAVEHERYLTFRLHPSTAADPARVIATLDRKTAFSPRAPNINLFDRYQLVPAASLPGDPATALRDMRHSFAVHIHKYGWRASSYDLNSVQCRPKFSGDVPLTIEYQFPMGLRNLGKRIEISENLILPNGFSEPTEFYE